MPRRARPPMRSAASLALALVMCASLCGAWPTTPPARAEQTEIPAAEYEALVALYNATNGPYWTTTWTLDDTPCDMYGVHCEPESGEPRHVTRLDLPSNVLKGSIPPEIGALTGLNYLNLSDNQLTGGLPDEMANLVALEDLNVDQNLLSGNLPAWLGTLTNLTRLDLCTNPWRGTIPSELFQLTNLTELFLDSCELTGPIPSAIGNLTALEELDLSGNALDGGIPSSLASATSLANLRLDRNCLEGPIPSALGTLIHLKALTLHANRLSGAIPANLANLTALTTLTLGYNMLWADASSPTAFLAAKAPGWENTQTVPPSGLQATAGLGGVALAWTAIPYTGDTGGYEVGVSTVPGGAYEVRHMTADKHATSAWIGGLTPGTTYYVAVRTVTAAHDVQQSELVSPFSAEVPCTPTVVTVPPASVAIAGPTEGGLGQTYPFTATVSPPNATPPLTYTWSPAPTTGQGTATARYQWETTGPKTVSVAVVGSGETVTATHSFLALEVGAVAVTPGAGGTLTLPSPGGRSITITIPPDAVTETFTLLYTPLGAPTDPPAGWRYAGRAFALSAYRLGHVVTVPLGLPAVIALTYSDGEVAGLLEDTLRLLARDDGGWVDAATTCAPASAYLREPGANRLQVAVCRLGEFALFAQPAPPDHRTLLIPLLRS